MTPPSRKRTGILASRPLNYLIWLSVPLIGFVALCIYFNFTQDDTYITLRYARNFLDGHGLVWNIGERIEGYTNFLWLILLILFKQIGLEFFTTLTFLGPALSIGTIFVSFRLVSELSTSRWCLALGALVAMLLVGNYAFIYWTVGGLESPLFMFLTVLAFYLYHRRDWLYAPIVALAILTRPEGILLAGFFPLFKFLDTRKFPRQELIASAVIAILILPFLVFKWAYFGGIRPNPYFAKTAWDFEQLKAGADYVWQFISGYALYGVVYLVPLLCYRKLPHAVRALYIFAVLYTLYIMLVGGDVLKVSRFFLPTLTALYASFVIALERLTTRQWIPYFGTAVVLTLSLIVPYDHVTAYLEQERGFREKMLKVSKFLLDTGPPQFSLATPTIGAIGYQLVGHDVYDMVGLTDSTVARHPQEPIAGLETTWRERKYNSEYILSRAPTYVLFSTSFKPSSPGEKALFLYDAFLRGYRITGFHGGGRVQIIYQKRTDSLGEIKRTLDAKFVMQFTRGIQAWAERDYHVAIDLLIKAWQIGPTPPYAPLLHLLAQSEVSIGENLKGFQLLDKAVELDSAFFLAHAELYTNLIRYPEYRDKALLHREYVRRVAPWFVGRLDSLAAQLSAQSAPK